MGWGGEEGDWEVLKDLDFGEERAAVSTALFVVICPFSPEGRVTVEPDSRLGWDMLGWTGWSPWPCFLQLSAMCVEHLEGAALSLLGPSGPVSPGRSEDVGRETQQRGVSWVENQRVWASAAGLTCPGPGTLSHSKGLVPLCARAPPSSSIWVSGGLSEEGADQWSSLS